jgi:hypothetical protein
MSLRFVFIVDCFDDAEGERDLFSYYKSVLTADDDDDD